MLTALCLPLALALGGPQPGDVLPHGLEPVGGAAEQAARSAACTRWERDGVGAGNRQMTPGVRRRAKGAASHAPRLCSSSLHPGQVPMQHACGWGILYYPMLCCPRGVGPGSCWEPLPWSPPKGPQLAGPAPPAPHPSPLAQSPRAAPAAGPPPAAPGPPARPSVRPGGGPR